MANDKDVILLLLYFGVLAGKPRGFLAGEKHLRSLIFCLNRRHDHPGNCDIGRCLSFHGLREKDGSPITCSTACDSTCACAK
jgi:hypothetical protein